MPARSTYWEHWIEHRWEIAHVNVIQKRIIRWIDEFLKKRNNRSGWDFWVCMGRCGCACLRQHDNHFKVRDAHTHIEMWALIVLRSFLMMDFWAVPFGCIFVYITVNARIRHFMKVCVCFITFSFFLVWMPTNIAYKCSIIVSHFTKKNQLNTITWWI